MESLKAWSAFQAVMAHGRQVKTSHFVLHQWQATPSPSGPGFEKTPALFVAQRLGILVPKRWAKRAVTRNLIRRQGRALMQERAAQLPIADYVLRLRQGYDAQAFHSAASPALKQSVRRELQHLLDQLVSAP